MKRLKIILLSFLLPIILFSGLVVRAQDLVQIDSLHYLIETSKNDSAKVYLQVAISKEYAKKGGLLALDYGEKALDMAERSKNPKVISYALFNMGSALFQQGAIELAIPYFYQYLDINKELQDEKAIADAITNIGAIYLQIGELDKASEYFKNTLALLEKMDAEGYKPGKEIIRIYNNFGENAKQLNQSNESALKELNQVEITARLKNYEKQMERELERKELKYQLAGFILLLTIIILSLLYFLSNSRRQQLALEKKNLLLTANNIALEKSQIENELEIKNKELATGVIYQIQKNELVNKVIEKLNILSSTETKAHRDLIKEILTELSKIQKQNAWEEFELRFQHVNNDFYKKLSEINPAFSVNDRRLCAFLKLDLTTKEISAITGQSYRSIEVARTRLRKKLNLTNSDTSLVEFISTI